MGKVQEEFNRAFPYLKIEFGKLGNTTMPLFKGGDPSSEDNVREGAKKLLEKDIRLSGDMKVSELEASIQQLFGSPVQVYRKIGNFWMETRLSREWTLKQHNEHGRDLASGL